MSYALRGVSLLAEGDACCWRSVLFLMLLPLSFLQFVECCVISSDGKVKKQGRPSHGPARRPAVVRHFALEDIPQAYLYRRGCASDPRRGEHVSIWLGCSSSLAAIFAEIACRPGAEKAEQQTQKKRWSRVLQLCIPSSHGLQPAPSILQQV